MYKYSKMKCINCGKMGHSYKVCREPKTSYGIIAFYTDNEIMVEHIYNFLSHATNLMKSHELVISDENQLSKITQLKNDIKLLLIMRRHTLGYMDFIRGHYNVNNTKQLKYMFEQMTPHEINIIKNNKNNFDYMWKFMWRPSSCDISDNKSCTIEHETTNKSHTVEHDTTNKLYTVEHSTSNGDVSQIINIQNSCDNVRSNETKNSTTDSSDSSSDTNMAPDFYSTERHTSNNRKISRKITLCDNSEYLYSKKNFEQLHTSVITLDDYLNSYESLYTSPEWGFPKGRRSGCESDLECAIREFSEETCYCRNDYILFDNIPPIVENIIGTNGISYRHVYYVAQLRTHIIPTYDKISKCQHCEIGDIGLFNIDTALNLIRPHHKSRKNIIITTFMNIATNILHSI